MLRTRAPALEPLVGGELALASLEVVRHLDNLLTEPMLVSRLSARRVAGLALIGDIGATATARANEVGLPLLSLPPSTNLYELEESIARGLQERRSHLYQQGLEIHRQLVELSIAGRGLPSIVERLAEITGRVAVFRSERLEVEHCAVPAGQPVREAEVLARLSDGGDVLEALKAERASAGDPPIRRLAGDGPAALVAPVFMQQTTGGFLYLISFDDDVDDADRVAIARASVVCTLELAKLHAVVEAEQRLRGHFFDELLEGTEGDETLVTRARRLGYELDRPFAVLLVRPETRDQRGHDGTATAMTDRAVMVEVARSARRLLGSQGQEAPILARQAELVILCPLAEPPSVAPALEVGVALLAQLGETRAISLGIGRHHPGLRGLRASYREAEQAITIGRHLHGPGHVTSFAELGVYRLLFNLKDNPDLADFCRETLSALVEYDAKNGTELVRTLDVFFAHGANLQDASDALFLHRNSLAYRLRRVEEVSGLRLDDFEDRFRLQLALKARQVLPESSTGQ